jgi:hypothetical protein
MIFVLLVMLLAALAVPLAAQEKAPAPPQEKPAPPAANPADVSSPDAILAALYDVISGPAGQKRNWDRFRSLFLPGARLIPTGRAETGEFRARVLDPEGYITRSSPMLEGQGFFEREVARRTERFGNVLHAFSTYEGRRKADDAVLLVRGINSIQLFFDGSRWWVVTVYWQAESPDTPLPKEYLPAAK